MWPFQPRVDRNPTCMGDTIEKEFETDWHDCRLEEPARHYKIGEA